MNKLRYYGRPNAEAVKFSYIAGLCADPSWCGTAGLICTNAIGAVPQPRPAFSTDPILLLLICRTVYRSRDEKPYNYSC